MTTPRLIGLTIVTVFLLLLLLLVRACGSPDERATSRLVGSGSPAATEAPSSPSSVVPPTTTTVVPIPTTLPVTTTTRPRPTTTTTEPEPEVQGEAVAVDGDDIETWLAIGRCEQPGGGWGGVRWDHPGPKWGGGLGLYMENGGTWAAFGGLQYAPTPGQATPMQQIQVARNVRARYGYSAWGCGRKLGLG